MNNKFRHSLLLAAVGLLSVTQAQIATSSSAPYSVSSNGYISGTTSSYVASSTPSNPVNNQQSSSSSSGYEYEYYSPWLYAAYQIDGMTLHAEALATSHGNVTLEWGFGDDPNDIYSIRNQSTVDHTYLEPGNYELIISAVDYPWINTQRFNITIGQDNEAPVADFYCEEQETNAGSNLQVETHCYSTSTDPNDNTLMHTWDFGNGKVAPDLENHPLTTSYTEDAITNNSAKTSYAEPGVYTITLTVTDGEYTETKTIEWEARSETGETIATPEPKSDVSCEYSIISQWNGGFVADVTITNTGDLPVNGWSLILSLSGQESINTAWNANVSENNPYQISNMSYNAQILPGRATSFGFVGSKGAADAQPPIFGGELCNP